MPKLKVHWLCMPSISRHWIFVGVHQYWIFSRQLSVMKIENCSRLHKFLARFKRYEVLKIWSGFIFWFGHLESPGLTNENETMFKHLLYFSIISYFLLCTYFYCILSTFLKFWFITLFWLYVRKIVVFNIWRWYAVWKFNYRSSTLAVKKVAAWNESARVLASRMI